MIETCSPQEKRRRRQIKLSPAQSIAVGFAIIIFVGAVLLSLPVSARDRQYTPFMNALFTAVSSTCVTGLAVYDTWTQFSAFGHAVILALVQLGGLGFMTVAVLFSFATKKRIGLKERTVLSEAVSSEQLGGIIRLVRRILAGTLVFELGGALLLAIRFCPEFGFWRGLWYGLFHSVTAFCNAGFDLMGFLEPGSSMKLFLDDGVVVFTLMALVLIGGIGFSVWSDLVDTRFRWRKFSLHTKLILTVTAVLFVVPTVLFLVVESDASMKDMSGGTRILAAMFQSVTTRTAGFAGLDNSGLSSGGKLLTMLLMFIGGAPGSTAGGVKTSTVAVAVIAIICYIRGRADVNLFDRRLDTSLIRRAFCTVLFNIALALCGVFVICAAQPLPLDDVVFEVISAISTTGLSTGITSSLEALPKLVIILLMYAGRVGSLTVLVAAAEPRRTDKLRNPEGKVIIG